MAEWLNVPPWKGGIRKFRIEGSNPSPSARIQKARSLQNGRAFALFCFVTVAFSPSPSSVPRRPRLSLGIRLRGLPSCWSDARTLNRPLFKPALLVFEPMPPAKSAARRLQRSSGLSSLDSVPTVAKRSSLIFLRTERLRQPKQRSLHADSTFF